MIAKSFVGFVAASLFASPALSQSEKKNQVERKSIEPVILEGKNSTGATLGIQWAYNDSKKLSAVGGDSGNDTPNPAAPISNISLGYKLSGTATANKDRNPKNFLEAQVDGRFVYDSQAGAFSTGLFGKYETDQSLDNKQSEVGVRATWAKYGFVDPKKNDFIALHGHIGKVDPTNDKQRKAALGTENPPSYNRWDVEALFMYPLNFSQVNGIELNYRYFKEISPPAAISAAGLDNHYLGTVRLGLKNDFYIAYSSGKLPFDRQSDKIFEAGWSFKLQ
ncbi:MAG TPA: hypothetical protein VEU32_02110 [Burkholderiales bacterium]|nr:hypothetical protein [Burkholderiales bacterium]